MKNDGGCLGWMILPYLRLCFCRMHSSLLIHIVRGTQSLVGVVARSESWGKGICLVIKERESQQRDPMGRV